MLEFYIDWVSLENYFEDIVRRYRGGMPGQIDGHI